MKEFGIYLLIVNIFTFIVYGVDKLKAKEHWGRISPTPSGICLALLRL